MPSNSRKSARKKQNRVLLHQGSGGFEPLEARMLLSITETLPEFNGNYYPADSTYPKPAVDVGTFNFASDLNGQSVTAATISGTFGNSEVGHTAGVNLYLGGILIASVAPYSTDWYQGGPWSYTFATSQMSIFDNGKLTLTAVQTNEYEIRLGVTTLAMQTGGLEISSLSTHTFIATDPITLKASIGAAQAGVPVLWTVIGENAASGISGFPTNVATMTDSSGTAAFTFTPSADAAFATNRHTVWTHGSLTPNPPISFDVMASAVLGGVTYTTRLSDTSLGPLTQDQTDILREEYYDYQTPVPSRSQVVESLGPGYDSGNYDVQLSDNLQALYDDVMSAYHGMRVKVSYRGRTYSTTIPDNAPVTISSGYLDPQRNKAMGSSVANNVYTQGQALDLVPGAVQVQITVNRKQVMVPLPLHGVLYPALYAAARSPGDPVAEHDATKVHVGNPRENNIQVTWA